MSINQLSMHCYHDCQTEELVACMTWAHHVALVTVADNHAVNLDREAVERLAGQLQDWLDKIGTGTRGA